MRIDFHTHAFPDALAPSAMASLARSGGALAPCTDGTASGLVSRMDEAGVNVSVVLNIAVKPAHQASILRSALHMRSERLIPFASAHPDAPDAAEFLEEIARLGIPGIKLHPCYQHFQVDDPRYYSLYRSIGRLGLITVFHAGMDIGCPPPCPCAPEALAKALPAFDGSPVVAAHFGGYMYWDRAAAVYRGTGIYIDTSYSHGRVIVPLAKEVIDSVGCDHVLFGSDAPWSDPAHEAALIQSLGLTPREEEAIFSDNARRLLGLNQS